MPGLICDLCTDTQDDFVEHHLETLQHRLNYMLKERKLTRKEHLHSEGIQIEQGIKLPMLNDVLVEYNETNGFYTTKLSSHKFEELGRQLHFEYTIRNDQKEVVYVIVMKLHPFEKYCLSDYIHSKRTKLEFVLESEKSCKFEVIFQQSLTTIGTYHFPIAITLQPASNPIAYRTLYRDVELTIGDLICTSEFTKDSPFCKKVWDNVCVIEPINQPKHLDNFNIPPEYYFVFRFGCHNAHKRETGIQQIYRLETINIWNSGVNAINYADYFHRLLWLEECTQLTGILQYNMSNVLVTLARNNVVLPVPGLAEKRPSVLQGDSVLIRLANENRAYKGIVSLVADESLIIEYLDPELLDILRKRPHTKLDISFVLSRLQLERCHQGIELCISNGLVHTSLFPKRPANKISRRQLQNSRLFNKLIANNSQQLIAVESIVGCTSQNAPYILFGPPGTGKTVTLVEAILQIKRFYPQKRILVCAPSNVACDMLARKLDEQLKNREKNDLFRVHTGNRCIHDVPTAVKYFSNIDGGEFYQVKPFDLQRFSIVISTLHLIGKFSGGYSPDMLFIDEAAQTTEPECDIPIGLLTPGAPIVLAGDPRQLGPVCGVPAEKRGLGKSLLDRFMETVDLYQPTRLRPLEYDTDFITMLVQNYRSHEDIIKIPNELFYKGALQSKFTDDLISNIPVAPLEVKNWNRKPDNHNRKSSAVEFIGVLSSEQRQGNSPSYYNEIEIDMVIKLVKHLMSLTSVRVEQREIGVIAPYIRQVVQIRKRLQALKYDDVQIGTTEAFQGGERRIMIISTVRAKSDLLLYDRKYDLGFVQHPRRFNVAITRAKAKLIIVGNPHVLAYDLKHWGPIMEHCKELGSYYGEDVQRDDNTREKIVRLLQRD